MLNIVLSNHFKRDLKLMAKRGLDLNLLDNIVEKLANEEPLDPKNKDHELKGNYKDFRECHILPDWLLIYRVDDTELLLFLSRTGSHSDLFNSK